MPYKTISTVLTDSNKHRAFFEAAQAMAQKFESHLDVLCLGLDHTQPGFYYAGSAAIVTEDSIAQAKATAQSIEDTARESLRNAPFNWSATGLSAQMVAVNGLIAHRTRFSDLVVLPQPYGDKRNHDLEAICEAAMFEGDVPVLIQPDDRPVGQDFKRVAIAWNESREALRAVRAAMPFLQAAETVSITIIDPPSHSPERSDPGGQLSQMLSRHGIKPEVSVLSKTLPRVADVLNRHVEDIDADLLVMGAYSHSRFRESILGGATRNMLEFAKRPLLLAH